MNIQYKIQTMLKKETFFITLVIPNQQIIFLVLNSKCLCLKKTYIIIFIDYKNKKILNLYKKDLNILHLDFREK